MIGGACLDRHNGFESVDVLGVVLDVVLVDVDTLDASLH